jgi:hypothetical protein
MVVPWMEVPNEVPATPVGMERIASNETKAGGESAR